MNILVKKFVNFFEKTKKNHSKKYRIFATIIFLIVLSLNIAGLNSVGAAASTSFSPKNAASQSTPDIIGLNSSPCLEPDEKDTTGSPNAPSNPAVNAGDSVTGSMTLTAPTLSLYPASDTGESNTDHLTGNNMPIFIGQAEAGKEVTVFAGNTQIGQVTADEHGQWVFAPDVCAALPDGTHVIKVRASDSGGNYSAFSNVLTFTIDTDPPQMPVITIPDNQSNVGKGSVKINGTGSPNTMIKVMDGALVKGMSRADGKGTWNILLSGLAPGNHLIRASAIDAAGNESPSFNAVSVVIDATQSVSSMMSMSLTDSSQRISYMAKVKPSSTPTKTATPTATKTSTPLQTATSVPTNTATPIPSATPTATETATLTATLTDIPMATSTDTPLPTVTDTVSATSTNNPTNTATLIPSATPTATETATPTATLTDIPTATSTDTPLPTVTDTVSATSTNNPTNTPSDTPTDTPTVTPTAIPTTNISVVAMAGGDIACGTGSLGNCQQIATSNLLVNVNPDIVLPLGDNQYECGNLSDFNNYYGPSWGRLKSKTYPSIGNHEYQTTTDSTQPCYNAPAGAPGYFTYFGYASTPNQPGCTVNCNGYYSYDIGVWHMIVLNSVCSQVGGCGLGSPEEIWLKNDLAAHPGTCTLAYWHYPRYTSGLSGTTFTTGLKTIWQDLYNGGVDIILNGHDHDYERFSPMDVNGNVDLAHGIREFIVGTGGKSHQGFTTIAANSEVRNADTFGVLKLTLNSSSYAWQFIPISGGTFTDSGSEACR